MLRALLLTLTLSAVGQADVPSVGEPAHLDSVVLPGSELRVRGLELDAPIVLRITDVQPHGDAMRYDFEYYGLEAGRFDLRDSLERINGESSDDLPSIPVQIRSVLPAGQIEPGRPGGPDAPSLGGYETALWIGGALWLAGLFVILAYRRDAAADAVDDARPPTLADRVQPLVEAAVAGNLARAQRAELELLVIAFWRERLQLGDKSTADALHALKQHAEAGPLLRGLEDWLHRPTPAEHVDLRPLLAPFESVSADRFDTQAARAH